MGSCRYDLEVKNVFPTRGRSWCKWEEDFLVDWLKDFGLAECARQLGRTPSSVALRCAWLGIRRPKQAEAELKPGAQTPEKAPVRPQDAKEGVEAGKDKGEVKAGDSGASESLPRKVLTIELPKAWTTEDDEKLLQMRGEGKSYADCGAVLGRTPHACESRLQRLKAAGPIAGLTPPSRSWSAKEEAVLRENWTKMLARDIVDLLPGRSLKAVYTRAEMLGLTDAYGLHNRGASPKPKPRPKPKLEQEPKPKPKAPRPARKRPTESKPAPVGKMRRCHDCGKPTTDFRCAECWRKLRRELDCGIEDDFIND